MTQSVVHQPRVAWDGARAFVRAAYSANFEAFAGRVYQRLGTEMFEELAGTRDRLTAAARRSPGDRYMFDVEAGRWRVRLQDLMQRRPDLVGTIQDLSM
jgi:hypothetical protein